MWARAHPWRRHWWSPNTLAGLPSDTVPTPCCKNEH